MSCPVLRALAGQRKNTILAGPMVQDHIHMLTGMPLTYVVASLASEKALQERDCPRNTRQGRLTRPHEFFDQTRYAGSVSVAAVGRMVSTGQGAVRTTCSATLPITKCRKPVRP